jgi:hypothetical protein
MSPHPIDFYNFFTIKNLINQSMLFIDPS